MELVTIEIEELVSNPYVAFIILFELITWFSVFINTIAQILGTTEVEAWGLPFLFSLDCKYEFAYFQAIKNVGFGTVNKVFQCHLIVFDIVEGNNAEHD